MSNSRSESRSEARLRLGALFAVGVTLLCALAFHAAQNRLALTGGSVALSKGIWLGLAVLFWLVLPALILADARIAPALKQPFMLLLLLMGARGVAELLMLYVFMNWSPFYGIAHDVLCVALLWGWCFRRRGPGAADHRDPLASAMWRHAWVTGALFLPEIYYAWYMQANFTTRGTSAVYFVPDDAAHSQVLAVTTAVDAVALAYLCLFLFAWLHGQAQRTRS
jgi:hypothetical protein